MKLEPLLYVSDLEKSIRFYTKVLGFKLGELYPDKEKPTYAPILIYRQKMMLVSARDMNEKFYSRGLGGSGVQFFIQVKDVNKIYKKVKDKAEIVDEIEEKVWGDREFTLKDPDGYLISFYTPT